MKEMGNKSSPGRKISWKMKWEAGFFSGLKEFVAEKKWSTLIMEVAIVMWKHTKGKENNFESYVILHSVNVKSSAASLLFISETFLFLCLFGIFVSVYAELHVMEYEYSLFIPQFVTWEETIRILLSRWLYEWNFFNRAKLLKSLVQGGKPQQN